MRTRLQLVVSAALAACAATSTPASDEIRLQPGQSIQAAIDSCPPGALIRLAPGLYLERIVIEKPLTLVGAGWDKTVVGDDAPLPESLASHPDPRAELPKLPPTLTIRSSAPVRIEGLRIAGPNTLVPAGRLSDETLVLIDAASVKMEDCAVVGPSMNGIAILAGSDVELRESLVAALWGTGVRIKGASDTGAPAKVHIVDCDIRNCCHRGVTTGSSDVTIEECRISGSAWHGIRYDGCSPTIVRNHIYGNARSGIYASGDTAAKVFENVFWRNEMSGVSCWDRNKDTIESNTFVGHAREAVCVLNQSMPTVTKNVFVQNLVAVQVSNLAGAPYPRSQAATLFSGNLFSENTDDFKIAAAAAKLPAGNASATAPLIGAPEQSFALPEGSEARRAGAGAANPTRLASRFPIQRGEIEIIPEGDARDVNLWRR